MAMEEARRVKPGALVQVMSSTDTAKQCVELTLHAQELGVDICYILTPYFECSGKPGVAAVSAVRRRPHRHAAGILQLPLHRPGADPERMR